MRKFSNVALVVLALTTFVVRSGHATEGGVPAGPIGGSDARSAYLPPTGLYLAAVSLGVFGTGFDDNEGRQSQLLPHDSFNSVLGGGGALYVYPFTVAGGTLGTSFQVSAQRLCIHLSFIAASCTNGLSDSYADLLIWSRYLGHFGSYAPRDLHSAYPYPLPYGLTVAPAISAQFPIGRYSPNDISSPSRNIYIAIPNVAVNYLTPPATSFDEGVEIAGRFYYETASGNPATHYHDGNLIDLDWAVTDRIGLWQAGIAGSYGAQLASDTEFGMPVNGNGNRLDINILGAVLIRDLPSIGAFVKLKATTVVSEHNGFPVSAVLALFALKVP